MLKKNFQVFLVPNNREILILWDSSKGQTGYWESITEHTAARVAFSGVVYACSRSSALGTGVLHVKAFEQHRGRKGEGERGKGKRWNIHLSMSFAFLFTLNRAG